MPSMVNKTNQLSAIILAYAAQASKNEPGRTPKICIFKSWGRLTAHFKDFGSSGLPMPSMVNKTNQLSAIILAYAAQASKNEPGRTPKICIFKSWGRLTAHFKDFGSSGLPMPSMVNKTNQLSAIILAYAAQASKNEPGRIRLVRRTPLFLY